MGNKVLRAQRGYSLVELVIVVSVIMILSAFAIIATSVSTSNSKANAAADAVISQFRSARELAISKRRNVQIQFTAPNQIQTTVLTLNGEAPAPAITPVYLNDNAAGAASFYVFPGLPDTPMAFGNSTAINFAPSSGGTAGLTVMFSSSGTLVGTTATTGYSAVGSNNPVNASIFVGIPGQPSTARAITVLGTTGRVRSYYWAGPSSGGYSANWQE
jgi:prepilin-type N-terminal cleavage/methylation domain-containing protein